MVEKMHLHKFENKNDRFLTGNTDGLQQQQMPTLFVYHRIKNIK